MKNLFLFLLASLIVFTQVMSLRFSKTGAEGKPVLYWVTDSNPIRFQQVAAFKKFLARTGQETIDLRCDFQNVGVQKLVIQGVSGVAGDLIDISGGFTPYFAEMGILEPMDRHWRDLGMSDADLLPAISNDIYYEGRPYGQPLSSSMDACLINEDTFQRFGLTPPPRRWTFDEFEKIGIEFTRRANQGLKRQERFFISALKPEVLRRTAGVSYFNETLTACTLDSKESIQVLERVRHWQDDLHLAPSEAELQSMSVDTTYGGVTLPFFQRGDLGILWTGRYALIQLRQMKGTPKYSASEPPNMGYPCALVTTRVSAVYKGGRYKEEARVFHRFLRSPEYADAMIQDGDAIPPVPSSLNQSAFTAPEKHTNEHDLHSGLRDILLTIAQGREYTPWALWPVVAKQEIYCLGALTSRVYTAEACGKDLTRRINEAIAAFLKTHPDKKAAYGEALEKQKKIDAIKASGLKIPLELVDNPFLKRYYRETGRGI